MSSVSVSCSLFALLPPPPSAPTVNIAAPATRAKDTTQRAIGPAVVVGQLFGLLPVHNITDYSGGANGLTFTFCSIRSIIAAILIAISCGEVALFLRRLVLLGFSVGGVTATFFFSSTQHSRAHVPPGGQWTIQAIDAAIREDGEDIH